MAKLEKLEKSKVKLTIDVSAEAFADAMQKAYFKDVKKFNIPGFRKGKAPRRVIENMYGEAVFYDTAFDILYPDAYEAAINETGIEPVDRPEIDIEEIGADKNLVFTATVAVKPEVTLGDYKGIEVEISEYNVTDEDIDKQVEREQKRIARYVDVERAVEQGDRVILDYSGSVGGKKFDGGTAEGQTLVIGSGAFIPGFEEQLVGMKVGEEKDITVTFPEEYHAEELKGKEAVFAVRINNVQVEELPELDDEFAKDISEFDTLAEYKADVRAKMEKQAEDALKSQKENLTILKAAENATVEIPEAMVERQVAHMLRDISYRLSAQGITFEDYLKYTGADIDSMKEQYRGEALVRVKTQLVLEAIGKAENIQADDAAVDEAIKSYAEQLGQTAEELTKAMDENDKEYFKDQVVLDKTIALLVEQAKFVPAPAPKKESAE